MTPTQLLDEAKTRFTVLYHNDTTSLNILLKQALGKYQEKAGSVGTVQINPEDEGAISLPSDYLEIMTAMDANTRYIESSIQNDKIDIVVIDDETEFPVTVHYFQNLREWVLTESLPPGMTSILLDYLVALIDVPNTERERAVAAATNIAIELPSKQELRERVLQLEEAMEESRSIGIPVAVW